MIFVVLFAVFFCFLVRVVLWRVVFFRVSGLPRAIYCFGKCKIITNSVVTKLVNTMYFFQIFGLRAVKLVFFMTAKVGF